MWCKLGDVWWTCCRPPGLVEKSAAAPCINFCAVVALGLALKLEYRLLSWPPLHSHALSLLSILDILRCSDAGPLHHAFVSHRSPLFLPPSRRSEPKPRVSRRSTLTTALSRTVAHTRPFGRWSTGPCTASRSTRRR